LLRLTRRIQSEQGEYKVPLSSVSKSVSPAAAHYNLAVILVRHGEFDRIRRKLAEARRMKPMLKQPSAIVAHLETAPSSQAVAAPSFSHSASSAAQASHSATPQTATAK
jgi:hypothetical protein